MGNESGEWIMHGMKWDNPDCIHSVDEAIKYIKGFQPELHHYRFYKTGFPLFHKELAHILRSYPFPSFPIRTYYN
jgi:hypothetical protein